MSRPSRSSQFIADHTVFSSHDDPDPPHNTECPICLEGIEDHICVKIVEISGCKHLIGLECLTTFLRNNPNDRKVCPVCRTEWLYGNDPASRAAAQMAASNARIEAARQALQQREESRHRALQRLDMTQNHLHHALQQREMTENCLRERQELAEQIHLHRFRWQAESPHSRLAAVLQRAEEYVVAELQRRSEAHDSQTRRSQGLLHGAGPYSPQDHQQEQSSRSPSPSGRYQHEQSSRRDSLVESNFSTHCTADHDEASTRLVNTANDTTRVTGDDHPAGSPRTSGVDPIIRQLQNLRNLSGNIARRLDALAADLERRCDA